MEDFKEWFVELVGGLPQETIRANVCLASRQNSFSDGTAETCKRSYN